MTRTVASMFARVVLLLLTACGGGHYRTASEAGLTRRISRTMAAFLYPLFLADRKPPADPLRVRGYRSTRRASSGHT